ncbi:MAG: 50S ribosomal protein L34 [Candidatus Omnitrophota bacterium]|nr:50S ribosomal protein L34 [Candidatus Omnitrophota bacterium]
MKKNLTTPSNIRGKRSQGFLKRMSTRVGRKMLSRRRRKGRKRISC